MKKLLLLLLPALLLASCEKKEKEAEEVTRAKALAGTYTYTRVGKFNDENGKNIQININVSGTATITHTDRNFFTITLTHDTTNIILDGCIDRQDYSLQLKGKEDEYPRRNYLDYFTFELDDRYHPDDVGIYTFPFNICPDEIIYDDLTILFHESFWSHIQTPNSFAIFGGTDLLTLSRQK